MAELAALERVDQRLRIDEAAAPGVDQHRAVLHPRERPFVDQMVRRRQQRAVQADDVGVVQQFVERDIARAERDQLVVVRRHRVREYMHPEAHHDLREHAADDAGADHADGLAVQVEAEQAVQREVALAGARDGARQAAVEGEDQRDRVLGNRVR